MEKGLFWPSAEPGTDNFGAYLEGPVLAAFISAPEVQPDSAFYILELPVRLYL
jgi:hypothetical protein